jgi:hypothetical protein
MTRRSNPSGSAVEDKREIGYLLGEKAGVGCGSQTCPKIVLKVRQLVTKQVRCAAREREDLGHDVIDSSLQQLPAGDASN